MSCPTLARSDVRAGSTPPCSASALVLFFVAMVVFGRLDGQLRRGALSRERLSPSTSQDVSKRFRLYHEKYTSLKERSSTPGGVPLRGFLGAAATSRFEVQGGRDRRHPRAATVRASRPCSSASAACCSPPPGRSRCGASWPACSSSAPASSRTSPGGRTSTSTARCSASPRREVDRLFDDIVDFAELEQFIDNQVKFYSSGMYVRLGFAVAVNVDPDVLVIDEVLAVGDERFQRKCMDRIKQFQSEGARSSSSRTRPTRCAASVTVRWSSPTGRWSAMGRRARRSGSSASASWRRGMTCPRRGRRCRGAAEDGTAPGSEAADIAAWELRDPSRCRRCGATRADRCA